MSQRQLSVLLGEHHSFMSRVERLQRDVTAAELIAIARELKLDPVELFRRALR